MCEERGKRKSKGAAYRLKFSSATLARTYPRTEAFQPKGCRGGHREPRCLGLGGAGSGYGFGHGGGCGFS